MWKKLNVNPGRRRVGDCVVRAIATATGRSWFDIYDDQYWVGRNSYDMPSSNGVWGLYLFKLGFTPFLLPDSCPECITIREFAKQFPKGTYIIGTGMHAVAVIDGNYYDTWDSGSLSPSYFFEVK